MKPNNQQSEERLDELAPHLAKLSKQDPFKVPDNYFEAFPTKVQSRYTLEAAPPLHAQLRPSLLQVVAGAWVMTIIIVVAFVFSDQPATQSSLTAEEIITVIESDYLASVDEALLVEMLAEDLELVTEDEPLIDYLIESDIDMSSIVEEL